MMTNFKPEDLKIVTYSSKKSSSWTTTPPTGIKIIHIPSDTVVTCEEYKSQHKNKDEALRILSEKLNDAESKTMKKITIEVDESLIPEGYEVVAFRVPNGGEYFISNSGQHEEITHIGLSSKIGPRLILKKKRWRADKGGEFSFINYGGQVALSIDDGTPPDDRLYEIGNYYKPDSEEVFEAQKRVLAAYRGEGE